MDQSNLDHHDAFSQTLERTPRTHQHAHHRLSYHQQQQQQQIPPTTTPLRGQSIHRLSRMFETEMQSSPLNKHGKPIKPKLPTKPPSLRSKQPSMSTVHKTDAMENTVKSDDSSVDQTSLPFQDIRARFQQTGISENKTSLRMDSTHGRCINHEKNIYHHDASNQPSWQQKKQETSTLTHRRLDSTKTETGERRWFNSTNDTLSPSSLPSIPIEHKGATNRPSLTRTSPVLSSPSRDMAPRLLIPKRHSQNTITSHLQPPPTPPPPPGASTMGASPTTVPPSSLHTISRSGTGNSAISAVSTSSLSSSSSSPAITSSPSRRAWNNYGNTLTNWFSSSGSDQQQQHQQSLKESIVMVNNTSSTSSTSSSSSSGAINNINNTKSLTTGPPLPPPLIHSSSFESLSSAATATPAHAASSALTSPPTIVSLQSTGSKQDKRAKVMDELWKTEKVYQEDMLVLKEIYYDSALSPDSGFSPSDVKHVFSNLLAIVDFEATFVDLLSNAILGDDGMTRGTVGLVFKDMMQQIDQVYCDYCKRHTDAVIRLQELESIPKAQHFLQACAEQLPGRTQSWDIGSLLIKPVQRVLKYPLLLKELLNTTPTDHPDYENLCIANNEIQNVADHINEIKRRKDIVEKIVGDKKKTEINVVHGINKKITRKAHRIRQVTGLAAEATQDTLFDTLHQKFEDQQEIVRQLARDIQAWVRQVKDNFDNLMEFATSLEDVYGAFGGVRVRSMNQIKEFTKMAASFRMIMSRELDTMVHGYIYSRIESFLLVFENPSQVISKRSQKLLDYDRVRGIKARGDIPDKSLQESADMYVSINAQLVEELPLLFNLTRQYFDIIVSDLAMVQKRFYEQTHREWNKLTQRLRHEGTTVATIDTIVQRYHEEMDTHVRPLIEDIMPLNKERWKIVLGTLPLTPLTDDLTGNSNSNRPPKGSDDYFGRTLSAQSFNDDDTRSTTSSRKYGSPVWKEHRGGNVVSSDTGRTPTDDESSKATTPQHDDQHSKTQGSSVTSYNNSNLAEPAFECLVIHDYLEPSQEALCVHKGDVIQVWVEDEDEDGLQGAWLYAGISVGHAEHFGWVPSQYCQRL